MAKFLVEEVAYREIRRKSVVEAENADNAIKSFKENLIAAVRDFESHGGKGKLISTHIGIHKFGNENRPKVSASEIPTYTDFNATFKIQFDQPVTVDEGKEIIAPLLSASYFTLKPFELASFSPKAKVKPSRIYNAFDDDDSDDEED